MKLCDCFCHVGGLQDGEYLFKNKLFPRFKVSFQKKNYEIIKTYLKDNQSFDDFSGDNYPLLMAMVQSDGWEMKN